MATSHNYNPFDLSTNAQLMPHHEPRLKRRKVNDPSSTRHEAPVLSTRVKKVSENKECLDASQPRFKVGGRLTGWRGFHPLEAGSHVCVCSACSDSVHLASLPQTRPKTKDKRRRQIPEWHDMADSSQRSTSDSSDRNKPEQSQ